MMFTGIVETTGRVIELVHQDDCLHLCVQADMVLDDLKIGDSIAVDGVCLTVTEFTPRTFSVSLVPETLRLTHFADIQMGAEVNLERALLPTTRMGGHYVQGHVDFIGEIISIEGDGKSALLVKIAGSKSFNRYIVNKGYITLDGMSITVIQATEEFFSVTFIPHTQHSTIVKHYQVGTKVNIEVDIMGKYIEKLLGVAVS